MSESQARSLALGKKSMGVIHLAPLGYFSPRRRGKVCTLSPRQDLVQKSISTGALYFAALRSVICESVRL